jgi:hypothetical protein
VSWFSFNGFIYLEDDMARHEAWRKELNRLPEDASGPPALTTDKRSLSKIAAEISKDWCPISLSAVPYLRAMRELDKITDDYGLDSGRSIVLYFLSNATTWRGEVARRVKAELKGMLK